MSRFYVPPEAVGRDRIVITEPKEINHIRNVMRLKAGDTISTFDGSGKEYEGEIYQIGGRKVVLKIVKVKETKRSPAVHITLAQAIPKLDRMDYIVEKATELGLARLVPIVTERTIVRLKEDGLTKRHLRWMRIAQAASKQCGRTTSLEVSSIIAYDEALRDLQGSGLGVIFCLSQDALPLKGLINQGLPDKVSLFIGPEGDFTPSEIEGARAAGLRPASLGPLTLRCDTAAIAALSILSYVEKKGTGYFSLPPCVSFCPPCDGEK